jgi:hypothetical protein
VAQPQAERRDDEPSGAHAPPVDTSDAIRAAYRFQRAKRRVRDERRRRTQLAGLRFAVTLAALVFVFVVLSLTVWAEVQRAFGL